MWTEMAGSLFLLQWKRISENIPPRRQIPGGRSTTGGTMSVIRLFCGTLAFCAAVLAAAVSVNAAEPAGPSPYEDVLTRARHFCGDGAGTAEDDNDEGMTGIIEAAGKLTPAECLERTGYAVRDINGDGTPECLIGKIDGENGVSRTGKQLYAVFTLRDGSPAPVMEGTFRNRIFLLDDGSLFREGYAGVMAFIFGVYRLPQGQSRTECLEFFFTRVENETSSEAGYYRNVSESLDSATAESMTQQAFEMKEKALAARVASLSLIPLAAFRSASSAQNGMPVRASRAESAAPENGAYDTFIADASESRVWIAFSASEAVKDFRFLRVSPVEDRDGNLTFSGKEMHRLPVLGPERPLAVSMTFYGSLPSYGISYTDGSGQTRRFTVGLSGEDGSVVLTAF